MIDICVRGDESEEQKVRLVLLYRRIFAADIKAACQAFSLQRTNGAPCVACECLVPTNVKPGGCCSVCGIWPCWHNGLTALHPEIMERACQGAIRCAGDPAGADLLHRHSHHFVEGFPPEGE
jgi:hypothetical protein